MTIPQKDQLFSTMAMPLPETRNSGSSAYSPAMTCLSCCRSSRFPRAVTQVCSVYSTCTEVSSRERTSVPLPLSASSSFVALCFCLCSLTVVHSCSLLTCSLSISLSPPLSLSPCLLACTTFGVLRLSLCFSLSLSREGFIRVQGFRVWWFRGFRV